MRVVYRERAWLLSQALSLNIERTWFLRSGMYKGREWPLGSGMVLVQRMDMAYWFRHGPFTPLSPPQLCYPFFQCLGSHHDSYLSGIVCTFIAALLFSWEIVISEMVCNLYFLQC